MKFLLQMQALSRILGSSCLLLPCRPSSCLVSFAPLRKPLPCPPSHHLLTCARSFSTLRQPQPQLTDRDLDTFSYGDAWYWDKRYSRDATLLEWYMNYSDIAKFMKKFVPSSGCVLVVGCGNSEMSGDMVNDGYQEIVNIDISSAVIDAMQKKYATVPQLRYMTMDAQDLSHFDDGHFDSVIDKGCLDAMMVLDDVMVISYKSISNAFRVLKPDGIFFLVIFGDPRSRIPDLNKEEYGWTTTLYIIPEKESRTEKLSLNDTEEIIREFLEPVVVDINNIPEDRDYYFVYICNKVDSNAQS